jgi:hypothetical protein
VGCVGPGFAKIHAGGPIKVAPVGKVRQTNPVRRSKLVELFSVRDPTDDARMTATAASLLFSATFN